MTYAKQFEQMIVPAPPVRFTANVKVYDVGTSGPSITPVAESEYGRNVTNPPPWFTGVFMYIPPAGVVARVLGIAAAAGSHEFISV